MKPTVGKIVHYQAFGTPGGEFKSKPRAAIITEVEDTPEGGPDNFDVTVCVLNPSGIFFNKVSFSLEPKPGFWSWPPDDLDVDVPIPFVVNSPNDPPAAP